MIKTTIQNIANAPSITEFTDDELLFYNIVKQDSAVYFPRSEFHNRFGSVFNMNKAEVFDTYHRSSFKRLVGVKKQDFTFLGNQAAVISRMHPKTGNFYNPYHFSAYQQAVQPTELENVKLNDASLYDSILKRQKQQANKLTKNLQAKLPNLQVNSDNHYTCVMVAFPKPMAEKNVKTWTSFIGVLYVAIINKLAMEKGINIETNLRASFSTYRPSVAECGRSLRLSLGVVPNMFLDCIVQAIYYVNTLLLIDDHIEEGINPVWKIPFQAQALRDNVRRYNEKVGADVEIKESLWDTLWAKGDASGRSFASQLFRKTHTAESLTDFILRELIKNDLDTIFADREKLKASFSKPLLALLNQYRLNDKQMQFQLNHNLQNFVWEKEATVNEPSFWLFVEKLCRTWRLPQSDLDNILRAKRTTHLHTLFDNLSYQFTFSPYQYQAVEDGNGSDSEEEVELDLSNEKKVTLHAKKLITATGMRAIQLGYHVAKAHLSEKKVDPLRITYDAKAMYYETDEAITRHPIPTDVQGNFDGRKKGHIGFFDLNHCNAMHATNQDSIIKVIYPKDNIAIIDTTSATTSEMCSVLKKLFLKRKQLEAIILISSGLKNEQAQSDNNPYGTVRIFAKTDVICDDLYACLVTLEDEANYLHPQISHQLRKTAKDCGMTPTNRSILQAGV